jgi:glycosyltransferase involved in cell wall biosynthesis
MNDTLVVIPHDPRRPHAQAWLAETVQSLGDVPILVATNVDHGPANAVAIAEREYGGFPRYVFNIDSDDRAAQPGAVQRMRDAMVEAEACCVFASFVAFNEEGVQPYPHQPFPTAQYFRTGFNQRGLRGFDWHKVRSIGGIDPTLKRFEWFDLARRLTHRYGDPAYVADVMTFYRLHPDQLTDHGTFPPELLWVLSRPLL